MVVTPWKKFAAVSLVIGIVTLVFIGILTSTTGALVHNAGSCFVVLIAALLYDRKFDILDSVMTAVTM